MLALEHRLRRNEQRLAAIYSAWRAGAEVCDARLADVQRGAGHDDVLLTVREALTAA